VRTVEWSPCEKTRRKPPSSTLTSDEQFEFLLNKKPKKGEENRNPHERIRRKSKVSERKQIQKNKKQEMPELFSSTYKNEIWRQSLLYMWPGQSYETVFLQQFVKQILLARSSGNSKTHFFSMCFDDV